MRGANAIMLNNLFSSQAVGDIVLKVTVSVLTTVVVAIVLGVPQKGWSKVVKLIKARKFEALNKKFVFQNNLLWKSEKDGNKYGPYCVKCFKADKLEMNMLSLRKDVYRCPHCNLVVNNAPNIPKENHYSDYIDWQ
jgi:hypothetical protein